MEICPTCHAAEQKHKDVFTMTEQEICDWMYKYVKEGKARFISGEPSKHNANTIIGLCDLLGWCLEDHRCALMRANPAYCHEQAELEEQGIFK